MTATRAFSHKVRTGCVTCKNRRIKCDEAKPACLRCVNTDRTCGGYVTEIRNKTRKDAKGKALIARSTSPTCLLTDAFMQTLQSDERRSYQYFRERTAHALAGFVETEFWNQLAPRVCFSQPAVTHAVLALSAHYELLKSEEEFIDTEEKETFMLQQYNRSMRDLVDLHGPVPADVTLICCLIFISLEIFRSNMDGASNHLEAGLKIIKDQRRKGLKVDDALLNIFSRLDIQKSSRDPEREPGLYDKDETFTDPSQIQLFFTVNDARNALDVQIIGVQYFLREAIQSGLSADDIVSLKTEQKRRLLQLQFWSAAFETLCHSLETTVKESPRITLLRIHFRLANVLLETALIPSSDTTIFDKFSADFDEIIEKTGKLVTSFEAVKQSCDSHPYASQVNLSCIAPIFFKALRRREPLVFQRSLSYLTSQPQHVEGEEEVARIIECSATVTEDTFMHDGEALKSPLRTTHGSLYVPDVPHYDNESPKWRFERGELSVRLNRIFHELPMAFATILEL